MNSEFAANYRLTSQFPTTATREARVSSAHTFRRHGSWRVLKKAAPVVAGLLAEPSVEAPREHLSTENSGHRSSGRDTATRRVYHFEHVAS